MAGDVETVLGREQHHEFRREMVLCASSTHYVLNTAWREGERERERKKIYQKRKNLGRMDQVISQIQWNLPIVGHCIR